jgi:hypothetical protein
VSRKFIMDDVKSSPTITVRRGEEASGIRDELYDQYLKKMRQPRSFLTVLKLLEATIANTPPDVNKYFFTHTVFKYNEDSRSFSAGMIFHFPRALKII